MWWTMDPAEVIILLFLRATWHDSASWPRGLFVCVVFTAPRCPLNCNVHSIQCDAAQNLSPPTHTWHSNLILSKRVGVGARLRPQTHSCCLISVTLSLSSPSCTLLSFVMELLKNSVAMQEQILACKGFLVIGHTLEKVRITSGSVVLPNVS